MTAFLKAAFKTLPLCAVLYLAGVVVLALADLTREATALWFTAGSVAALAMWLVAAHEAAERGGK